MINKNQLKFYATLKERKPRTESGLFIVEGHKVVNEGLRSPCRCEAILVRKGFTARDEETGRLLAHPRAAVLDEADFNRLARTDNPQGVLGIFDWRTLVVNRISTPNVVALFDVADPRNMGTIIRTLDWFGMSELLVGEGCVDFLNEKVVRSTVGSIFHCRFLLAADLIAELGKLKATHQIVTADIGGADYRERPRGGNSAFVFSNEARGPSEAILALTDRVVTIPGSGLAESLNVASAAAIILATVG
jgi:TrmH family RNA methyltransferase